MRRGSKNSSAGVLAALPGHGSVLLAGEQLRADELRQTLALWALARSRYTSWSEALEVIVPMVFRVRGDEIKALPTHIGMDLRLETDLHYPFLLVKNFTKPPCRCARGPDNRPWPPSNTFLVNNRTLANTA